MAHNDSQANFLLVPHVKALRPRDVADMNDDDNYEAFKALRWGWNDGRPECVCGAARVYEYDSRRIFKCAKCGKQFSVSSGTLFHARKLAHRDIIGALATTIHDPVNAHRLSQRMGLSYRTARRLIGSFRLFVGNVTPRVSETRWPYLNRAPRDEMEELMLRVSVAIPRGLPEQVRADVGQEMVLGLLDGGLTEEGLRMQLRQYLRAHYNSVEFNQFRDLSLNQPVPGTDGMMWDDVLSDEVMRA